MLVPIGNECKSCGITPMTCGKADLMYAVVSTCGALLGFDGDRSETDEAEASAGASYESNQDKNNNSSERDNGCLALGLGKVVVEDD